MSQVYLGLGANLGDPQQHLVQGITQLSAHPALTLDRVSRLYRSRPMGPIDQPDYLNAVVSVQTSLEPECLLDLCQTIEQLHQRERLRHWGERTLDIDILLYGDMVINTPRLMIPHVGIALRDFVLLPLADLAPELMIPILGQSVSTLLDQCPSFGATPLSVPL